MVVPIMIIHNHRSVIVRFMTSRFDIVFAEEIFLNLFGTDNCRKYRWEFLFKLWEIGQKIKKFNFIVTVHYTFVQNTSNGLGECK